MKKVTTIVGTRPELIRLSAVICELEKVTHHRLIHTGQNFDRNLKDVFFEDLKIPNPDVNLEVADKNLGLMLGNLFSKVYQELVTNRPDAVVVLGDTNSALSVILAKRLGITTYHLEAGNRSFDVNVPEETNRRIIDHAADFNLVYTEHARRNLINEGLHPRQIALIGSPLKEVFLKNQRQIDNSEILEDLNLSRQEYILVSLHREENVDDSHRLTNIMLNLVDLAKTSKKKLIFPVHPRTKNQLREKPPLLSEEIVFIDPVGFFDYCKLQQNASLIISDSGSISEEAAILGLNAVTVRVSMERPEALESNVVRLINPDSEFTEDVLTLLDRDVRELSEPPLDYEITNSSHRTVNFILSTIDVSNTWIGRQK